MKYERGFLFLCILIFTFNGAAIIQATELERTGSIIREGNKIQIRSWSKLICSNGFIFLVENIPGNRLLQFSFNGELLKSTPGIGFNPGELLYPTALAANKASIAVKDDRGISIFTKTLEFQNRFYFFGNILDICWLEDSLYVLRANPLSSRMIEIYNPEGKWLGEIGEKLFSLKDLSEDPSPFRREWRTYSGNLLTDGKRIYYLNSPFGIASVFEADGKKIGKWDLAPIFGEKAREIIEKNKKELIENKTKIEGSSYIQNRLLFDSACMKNGTIYLMIKPESDLTGKSTTKILAVNPGDFSLIEELNVPLRDDEIGFSFTAVSGKKDFFIMPVFNKNTKTVDLVGFRRKE